MTSNSPFATTVTDAAAPPAAAAWVACAVLLSTGCGSAPPDDAPELDTVVEASVREGDEARALAQQVWGLTPADPMPPLDAAAMAELQERVAATGGDAPQDPAPEQDPADQGPDAEQRATLRARFGSTILIGPDGTITKQYFLTGEAGEVCLNLLAEPGAAPRDPAADIGPLRIGGAAGGQSILAQMLSTREIELFYLRGFETPAQVDLRGAFPKPIDGAPVQPSPGSPNNLLLVRAEPDALGAFEGALNLFFANIPQIEIEIKVVEYSTSDALTFGIQPIDATTPTLDQLSSKKLVQDVTSLFPASVPILGAASLTDRGIITLGGIHDSWQLAARLEALEAVGVADVLSSPKLVVRNSGVASVLTRTDLPYPEAKITSSGQNITSNIVFKPVGIDLRIRPVIAGTETVILQVFANISAVTGFADTDPVDTPIVSSREVVTAVHVPDGKTTVIGGLVSSSSFEQTTQMPILGDIPILGYLFRSTSTTVQKTTLEFHITPRIIQGGGGYVGG